MRIAALRTKMAVASPRVAVVGGGIAGSMCALVLRSRGLTPTILDMGRRVPGGRLAGGRGDADLGAQFFRASDPQLMGVVRTLEREGLVARWVGRFGVLGTRGGGFLPAEVVAASTSAPPGQLAKSGDDAAAAAAVTGGAAAGGEEGDFCNFVNGFPAPTYVTIEAAAGAGRCYQTLRAFV